MRLSILLVRPLLRLVMATGLVVTMTWLCVGLPMTRRVNEAATNLLRRATSQIAAYDLQGLREQLETARRRLGDAQSRRQRVAELLKSAKARGAMLQAEITQSRTALKEIVKLLGSSRPVLMVANQPYKREVVERDASAAVRRYDRQAGQLRAVDVQIRELTASLARVDCYIARASDVLDTRGGVVSRMEEQAECQRLLRDVGELMADDEAGFEMRLERARVMISPSSPADDDDADGGGPYFVSADEIGRRLHEWKGGSDVTELR